MPSGFPPAVARAGVVQCGTGLAILKKPLLYCACLFKRA